VFRAGQLARLSSYPSKEARRSWVHPQFGADFGGRFFSREAAKNAKGKACDRFPRLHLRTIPLQQNGHVFAFFAFFA
jgi:hypothetical protein